MNKQIVSVDELIAILNEELSKFDECEGCRYTNSVTRLRETDPNGCNWSSVTLQCSGVSSKPCKPISLEIIYKAKQKYNLSD